jgi:hypothetical protein
VGLKLFGISRPHFSDRFYTGDAEIAGYRIDDRIAAVGRATFTATTQASHGFEDVSENLRSRQCSRERQENGFLPRTPRSLTDDDA